MDSSIQGVIGRLSGRDAAGSVSFERPQRAVIPEKRKPAFESASDPVWQGVVPSHLGKIVI
jgi:hypothetical protein